MKSFILLFLLIVPGISYSQSEPADIPIDSITGKYTFTQVVKIDSVNADQLYIAARMWATDAFKSVKDAIQMEDKQAHVLMLKGTNPMYVKGLFGENTATDTYYHFTMKIECKDGRYKYTITDFYLSGGWASRVNAEDYKGTKNQNQNNKDQIKEIARLLSESLRQAMTDARKASANSEW